MIPFRAIYHFLPFSDRIHGIHILSLVYDHRLGKEIFVKLNSQTLLREVYPKLQKNGSAMSIADIYIKLPYETVAKKVKTGCGHRADAWNTKSCPH